MNQKKWDGADPGDLFVFCEEYLSTHWGMPSVGFLSSSSPSTLTVTAEEHQL